MKKRRPLKLLFPYQFVVILTLKVTFLTLSLIITQSTVPERNKDLRSFLVWNCLCFSCFEANLNGEYYTTREPREAFRGLIWEHWLGDVSLKKTEMKIRSRDFTRNQDPDFDDRRAEAQLDDVKPLAIPEDP